MKEQLDEIMNQLENAAAHCRQAYMEYEDDEKAAKYYVLGATAFANKAVELLKELSKVDD